MATVKMRIVRGFCLAAGRDVFPGDVVEVTEVEARLRISQGKAAAVEDRAKYAAASGKDTEKAGQAIKTTKGKSR